MILKFLGANRQVTGSCYYLETGGVRLLVDCGLFQERAYLERNWKPFPISPAQIDYLLLTHVHLDHSGLIPKLVKEGFSGIILTTSASQELLPIVLLDSARIQEEDAGYKKKRHQREGRRGPFPEIPLYTVQDAEQSLSLLQKVPYQKSFPLNHEISVCFHDAGHILGSSMIEITIGENGNQRKLIFSGDIGQWHQPIIRDPSVFKTADYVITESTYGDRNHEDPKDVEGLLTDIINETAEAGGKLIIPTFAVERAQELLFYLSRLVRTKRIPHLPIFLDSPMATDVTEVFNHHQEYMDKETLNFFRQGQAPFRFPGLKFVRSVEESKAINRIRGSCIILAGSGMCTGGRVKHHLVQHISHPESIILFVGYQAVGTLGRQIIDGQPRVRIHGQFYDVRARVKQIHTLSAHADQRGLQKWLNFYQSPPRQLFITHGEETASRSLASFAEQKKGWSVRIPKYLEEWELK